MLTAKLFDNGRSQAVRLPKQYRFQQDEVLANKVGNVVMLFPKDHQWAGFLTGLQLFTDDFFSAGRSVDGLQDRDSL